MKIELKTKSSLYLPGLNGLRFFAAIAVIITHLELLKSSYDRPSFYNTPIGSEAGPLGVIFFFVLSGFLITYLLLIENETTGKISFKKFYFRRVLRIFPLYYLAVFLGFFVFFNWDFIYMNYQHPGAQENFWNYFWMYLLLIPNVTLSFFERSFPHIGQLWSIGVEEHFYIIWPFLLSIFSNKPIRIMITFLLFILFLKGGFWIVFKLDLLNEIAEGRWRLFLATEKLECMAIGGVSAYYFFTQKDKLAKWLNNPLYAIGAIFLVIVGIHVADGAIQDMIHVFYSICFMIVILVSMQNNWITKILELKFINYFGQVSFGMYIYHLIIVTISFQFFDKVIANNFLFNVVYYTVSLGVTLIISHLSFKYFEGFFLKMKGRYSSQ